VAVFKLQSWTCTFFLQHTQHNSISSSTLIPVFSLFFPNSLIIGRDHEIRQRQRERERSLHQFAYADSPSPSSPGPKPWHQVLTCIPLPSNFLFRHFFIKFSIFLFFHEVGPQSDWIVFFMSWIVVLAVILFFVNTDILMRRQIGGGGSAPTLKCRKMCYDQLVPFLIPYREMHVLHVMLLLRCIFCFLFFLGF